MNEPQHFEPTVPGIATPTEGAPMTRPVAEGANNSIFVATPVGRRTWQENVFIAFQIAFILTLGLLSVFNILLMIAIFQRSDKRRLWSLVAMIASISLSLVGSVFLILVVVLSMALSGTNNGSSVSTSFYFGFILVGLVLSFVGSIWPYAYYVRVLPKR